MSDDPVSDTPLSAERLNEERAFIKRYTEGLAKNKVEYPADFSTPAEDRPRKVPVVNVSFRGFRIRRGGGNDDIRAESKDRADDHRYP